MNAVPTPPLRDLLRTPKLLALWLLVRVAGRAPLVLLYAVSDVLGTLAWAATPRLREVTRDHMRHVLASNASSAAIDRAARGCVRSAVRYYADFAYGANHTPRPFESSEGLENITAASEAGHGVILLSAHLGNPESISHATAALGLDLMILTEPLQPRSVHDFVHAVRAIAAPGVRYVPADLGGVRATLEHLRAGGTLAVLGDRDVLGNGDPLTFFGERARLPGGIADLALRTGAAVVPGIALRTSRGGIRAVVRPPLDLAGLDREEAGRRIAAALEAGIALAPDQWFPLSPVWDGLAT